MWNVVPRVGHASKLLHTCVRGNKVFVHAHITFQPQAQYEEESPIGHGCLSGDLNTVCGAQNYSAFCRIFDRVSIVITVGGNYCT
jgi:hypothetical protein